MQQLASFLSGTWQSGRGRSRLIHHAISGEALWEVTSEGLDMAAARQFAIEKGAPALRAMTFIERAAMLKAVAKHLLSEKSVSMLFLHKQAQRGQIVGLILKAVLGRYLLTPASVAGSCLTIRCGRKMN
ncbi:bifunctional aldehyde dehydrogenase/enoyl-CoA hydratase [Escherichia coli]|uniref:Bifunctional aldehyde dehydrogenase/enoyl-CoA hydratase n=1 Tax=Escherichia coli TaxID=562 RepID=A0A376MWS7_ECOLX|nr:bifunctional aldehyde dehydrogenase/enoyl-CoA hydratase [Escherichia coli]